MIECVTSQLMAMIEQDIDIFANKELPCWSLFAHEAERRIVRSVETKTFEYGPAAEQGRSRKVVERE
jgi:hypothetical protein